MKPILTYALIFVISLSLSVFLHHFSAADAGQDSLGEGMSFAKEDIHRLVDHEFAEKRDAALMDDFGDQRLLLGPLEKDLQDLQARQAELLAKIDGMVKGDPLAGVNPDDIKLPVDGRMQEIVGATIQRVQDEEQRARQERAEERRKERDAARRVELEKTLTDKLRLVGDQPARIMAVLDGIDEQRNKMFQDMRAMRESGGDAQFDFQKMRESFTAMQEKIDNDVKTILNPDQVSLFDDYKKESPWTFGGAGMMRGGRARGGGGGFGGGQGGAR